MTHPIALGPFHGPKVPLPSLLRYSHIHCKSNFVPFEDWMLGWTPPMSKMQAFLPRKGLAKCTKACQWQLPSAWCSSAAAQSKINTILINYLKTEKENITHILIGCQTQPCGLPDCYWGDLQSGTM